MIKRRLHVACASYTLSAVATPQLIHTIHWTQDRQQTDREYVCTLLKALKKFYPACDQSSEGSRQRRIEARASSQRSIDRIQDKCPASECGSKCTTYLHSVGKKDTCRVEMHQCVVLCLPWRHLLLLLLLHRLTRPRICSCNIRTSVAV